MCGAADAQTTNILLEILSFVSQQIFLLNFYHSNSCPAHRGVKKESQTQRIGQRHTLCNVCNCVGKGTHCTLCFEAQIVQPVCAQTALRTGQYNLRGSVWTFYICINIYVLVFVEEKKNTIAQHTDRGSLHIFPNKKPCNNEIHLMMSHSSVITAFAQL